MNAEILQGDAIEQLRTLPRQSVHTCVTSPPYWNLRDYGVDGQIGLESTPAAYVARMVAVFEEVRRVLRDDATVWLNIGDSYAGSGPSGASYQSKTTVERATKKRDGNFAISTTLASRGLTYAEKKPVAPAGLKSKDMCGIPWMLAFALRDAGWYLRQEIIWAKPNPMPESVTDRCTKSHESIFLLAKSERYYYDANAIREPYAVGAGPSVAGWAIGEGPHTPIAHAVPKSARGSKFTTGKTALEGERKGVGQGERQDNPAGRNKRSVWTVSTQGYPDAHFATFPPDLIKPCILAGAPEGGTVLDPFAGSGTTLWTANSLCRHGIGVELNPAYCDLIRKRLAQGFLDWTSDDDA